MCFSAQASFVAAGLLSVIGIYTIQKTKYKSQIPFASIPLFFGLQQLIEGCVWLALTRNAELSVIKGFSYTYLAFAFPFWPIWIPFSLLFLEKGKFRRSLLFLTLFIGAAIAGYSIYGMAAYGISTQIISHHIVYNLNIPQITNYDFVLYLIATIFPFFIINSPILWIFGVLACVSLILTYIFYLKFLISIWCFFAAILSILIYFYIVKKK